MGSVARRLREESDFTLATEIALSCLADDKDQQTMAKMISFMGFEQAVLFFVAFGGTRIKVPKIKDFSKHLSLAKAGLAVIKGGKKPYLVARDHALTHEELSTMCKKLRQHITVKRAIYANYSRGEARLYSQAEDALHQIDNPEENEYEQRRN